MDSGPVASEDVDGDGSKWSCNQAMDLEFDGTSSALVGAGGLPELTEVELVATVTFSSWRWRHRGKTAEHGVGSLDIGEI